MYICENSFSYLMGQLLYFLQFYVFVTPSLIISYVRSSTKIYLPIILKCSLLKVIFKT